MPWRSASPEPASRQVTLAEEPGVHSDQIVGSARAEIERQELAAVVEGCQADDRVVRGPAHHAEITQRVEQAWPAIVRQREPRDRERPSQEVADDASACSVWRRQPSQDGVRLKGDGRRQVRVVTQRPCCSRVILVPGGESGNDDTGVDCDQRRTRSTISRTC